MLNDFNRSKRKIWIHGHTHTTLDPVSLKWVDETTPFKVCSFEHHSKYCTNIYFDNKHNRDTYISLMTKEHINIVEDEYMPEEPDIKN